MKRIYVYILTAIVVVGGAATVFLMTGQKSCSKLSEAECKKNDHCVSVLIPNTCDDPPCSPAAVFKECKDKSGSK